MCSWILQESESLGRDAFNVAKKIQAVLEGRSASYDHKDVTRIGTRYALLKPLATSVCKIGNMS